MFLYLENNQKTRAHELFEYARKRFVDHSELGSLNQMWKRYGGERSSPIATS